MPLQWIILIIIILIYLPVSIDATVLHVAIPTLNDALNLSNTQLLWVIDIYSLIMAGLILPMGALGDRIGYKRLMLIGSALFGLASLCAAFSDTAYSLIASRALLAVGAAMIIPATLSSLRLTFLDEKQRNFALGIWGTVGGGGAAIGPLVGGFILEHYHWGSIFLINIPIILVAMFLIYKFVPKQATQTQQALNLNQALVLVTAILLIIYAIKTAFYAFSLSSAALMILGVALLTVFIRHQLKSSNAMIDFKLFAIPMISISIFMAMVAMMALVGFELLLAQELQFIYGYSPLEAGMYILPFILAISCGGPLASVLVNRFGLKPVSISGLLLAAVSFIALAQLNFKHDIYWAWGWMALLGVCIEIVLLSSTAAIMSAAPANKATAVGAIEGMAYELGAGFGVAFFGLLLSFFYVRHLVYPNQGTSSQDVTSQMPDLGYSIGESMQAIEHMAPSLAQHATQAVHTAFSSSHQMVLYIAASLFAMLALVIWFKMPKKEPL